jgi:cellobiose-specific phosphotransferase system component IIB
MDNKTIFSKTGKGVLEIKNKAGKLPRDLVRVLTLIDGKSTVADLATKSKLNDAEINKALSELTTGGYIKEFANTSTGVRASGEGAYVDDLDFTSSLSTGKNVYQNAQSEWRQRETADRTKAEQETKLKREEEDRLKKEQAAKQAREEGARLAKIEAERKAKEAAGQKLREETERKAKVEAAVMGQTQRDLAKILEAERKAFDLAERKKLEEQQRKANDDAERRTREEAELKVKNDAERRREDEERRRKEEDDRKRKEEDERRRREDEERKRKEDEERKRKEEDERRRREDEERKKREEEDRRRREDEERKKREEEERARKEAEERARREDEEKRARREDEDRRRREEDERRRREDEEAARARGEDPVAAREAENRRVREDEERSRRDEEDARRRREEDGRHERDAADRRREDEKRREREETDRRREEESRRKREEDERARQAASAKSDLPEFDLSGLRAMESQVAAEFEMQQKELRKREEEEERRREQEEQARRAVERAEREEQARAEAERREAEDLERRERMDRERQDREGRERKRQEEKEGRIREQEEAKIKREQERLRQETAKVENERRSREDDLARRRKEQEERDRKRAEVDSLKKQKGIKTPLDRLKPVIIGVAVLLAVVLGGVQLVPMNSYLPAMQLVASEHIKEPVSIGSMHVSILGGFTINLQNIKLGTTQDVKIDKVSLSPELGSVFGDVKIFRKVEVDSVTVAEEALSKLPKWFDSVVADKNMRIDRIVVKSVKIESRNVKLPTFNADLQLSPGGAMQKAVLSATDGKLNVELAPHDDQIDIALSAAKGWVPPIGPQIEFTDLTVKAVATHNQIRVENFDALLYGGAAKGSALIVWGGPWSLDGEVATERISLQDLMAVFTRDAKSTGQLESKFRYSMASQALPTLFNSPRLEGSFDIKKGDLDGVDLVRALQSGGRGVTQGGATRFEEIDGTLALANGHYQYRNMRLSSGLLSASGAFEVTANKDVSGRISVELRSQAAQIKGKFIVDGDLKAVVLRPN